MDKMGAETLVLIAKATYDIFSQGKSALLATEQIPIQASDEYYGEPGKSSVRYESDLALRKLGTDVVLHGHALGDEKGSSYVDVTLTAGKVQKTIRAFGNRDWDKVLGRYRISDPAQFQLMPLKYELAFGGIDSGVEKEGFDPRNPVGKGFHATSSKTAIEGTVLPNFEDPQNLIEKPSDRPQPAGFGFIAKTWEPRRGLAGTYDGKWMTTKMPLLPDDFDDRFNNGASPGLVSGEYFQGGEMVEVDNIAPSRRMHFVIPKEVLCGTILVDAKMVHAGMQLDSVLIDADRSRLQCVWRAIWNIHRIIEDIRWIRVERMES